MKLLCLINARKIISGFKEEKMPTILAYKMMKFIKASDNDEAFFNEKLRDIVNRYGLRDERDNLVINGESISLVPELISECKIQINELENTEIDLPSIYFNLNELGALKMSMLDLFTLQDLIKEE